MNIAPDNASMSKLKNHKLPIQIEGFPYILAGVILFCSGYVLAHAQTDMPEWLYYLGRVSQFFGLFLTAFSVWFYRCPQFDVVDSAPNEVLSPASGRVLKIEEIDGSRIGESRAKKISIFMSPVDVHVNRAPISGPVETIQYVKGKFFKADLDKASEENEHNWLVQRHASGKKVAYVQIAGFVARRIVCYITTGTVLAKGERYGMIRFGSRMEVVVPLNSEICVHPGDRTEAGRTLLAKLVV